MIFFLVLDKTRPSAGKMRIGRVSIESLSFSRYFGFCSTVKQTKHFGLSLFARFFCWKTHKITSKFVLFLCFFFIKRQFRSAQNQRFFVLILLDRFCLVFGKKTLFWLKIAHIDGNRQTAKFSENIKRLSVLDIFSPAGCTKSPKSERVMIVQTHAHDEENGWFFLFPTKKQ